MSSEKRWRIAQFFEIRWWRMYLKSKSPDEYLFSKKKYWLSYLDSLSPELSVPREASILDVGAGPAGIFILWDNNKTEALDPLFDDYEKHLPHFSPKRYPGVNFHTVPFEQFTTDKKYDIIFCLNAVNHFIDVKASLQKLYRLTKDGGMIVLSVDTHAIEFLQPLFSLFQFDILHPHQFSHRQFTELIKEIEGFEIIGDKLSKKGILFDFRTILIKTRVRRPN